MLSLEEIGKGKNCVVTLYVPDMKTWEEVR